MPTVIMYLPQEYNKAFNLLIGYRIAFDKDITGNVFNGLSIISLILGGVGIIEGVSTAIAGITGLVSFGLGAIALILAFMPKPVLERLRKELDKVQNSFVKVTLFDVNPGDKPIRSNYNIQKFKVEEHTEYINKKLSIYGERYLLGGIGLLKKTKNIDDLSKGIEKTFANINQYFNSGR
jgi:hypothetical protein